MSVLVFGEIRRGIERLRSRDGVQAEAYEHWLNELFGEYQDRILPVTAQVAERWGRFNAIRTLPVIDGLMAATAAVMGLTLVTRNVSDLAGIGVQLLNPFEPPA